MSAIEIIQEMIDKEKAISFESKEDAREFWLQIAKETGQDERTSKGCWVSDFSFLDERTGLCYLVCLWCGFCGGGLSGNPVPFFRVVTQTPGSWEQSHYWRRRLVKSSKAVITHA